MDAVDYQGKWYPASIVAVEPAVRKGEQEEQSAPSASNNPEEEEEGERSSRSDQGTGATTPTTPIARVKVHFDNFASKWDEWYEVDTTRLCPPGSVTGGGSVKSGRFSPIRHRSSRVSVVTERYRPFCWMLMASWLPQVIAWPAGSRPYPFHVVYPPCHG